MEGQSLDWFFPFLRTNTQQTQRKGKEREGRKKKMYAGGRLTYFVAVFNLDAGKEEAPAYIKTAIIYPN